MCVQFMIKAKLSTLARLYDAECPEEFTWKPHVFPRYPAPAIVVQDGRRSVCQFHFGLIPFFEKESKPKKVFHNARLETVAEKVSFKRPYLESRCVIPLESFFEYVSDESGRKKRIMFAQRDGEMLHTAGIYNIWKSPEGAVVPSFAIITTEPPQVVRDAGHDRCPLFLSLESAADWLSEGKKSAPELAKLIESQPPPGLSLAG